MCPADQPPRRPALRLARGGRAPEASGLSGPASASRRCGRPASGLASAGRYAYTVTSLATST